MKILYVEGNPHDGDLTRRWLGHAPDIDLETSTTQKEAVFQLTRLGMTSYDLVLTDLHLEDGDGLSLLRYIRKQGLPVAVVVITGSGNEETAVEVIKAGGDDYVTRRNDYLERLPSTLKNALRHHRSQLTRYLDQLPDELENAIRKAELMHEKISLSQSEARNRAILEAIPDLVFLMSRDGVYLDFHAKDPSVLFVPPEQFIGRNMRDVFPPQLAERFAKCFKDIAHSGQSGLVEYSLPILSEQRHYEARVVHCDPDNLLSVVSDVTERKRAELNTQFINQLNFALSQIADAEEIIRLATNRLGEYIGGTSCYIIEVNAPAYLATVHESWEQARDTPSVVGEYRITDYVTQEFIQQLKAGQASVVNDVTNDPRTRDFAAKYEPLGVAAFISMPALNEQEWEATLTVNSSRAREWRSDEMQLMRDVTARVWPAVKQARAVKALRESEQRFRQLAEHVGAVFYIAEELSETSWGRVVYVSPAYEKIWGRSRESLYQDMTSWLDAIHPEDRDRVWTAMHHVKQAQFDEEFRVVQPSGEIRWVHDRVFPISNERGEVYRLAGIVEDITEHKQAQESLRLSEERARRTLVEQMLAGVAECDAAGRFVLVNQRFCDILGYTEAELLEMRLNDVTHHDDLPRISELYRRLMETGESFVVEKRYLRKDGLEVWVNSNVSPIRNAQNEVVESVAIVIDVTDRKHAEREREQLLKQEKAAREEAQAANRSKDEFLAVVSHELRSPLTSILGYTSLLKRSKGHSAEIQRIVEILERNGRVQLQLIEDLLDTARIISGKLKLEVQRVDLISVIAGALDVMRPAAEAKGIELRSDLKPLDGQLTGDPNRLQQIVWNLLSNAIKFTSRSGCVEVRLENVRHQVQITVTDTGRGIEPEFLPYVFERFRQSDSSSARRFGGLGLGLSLVKQLVELHGGTIEAASGGADRGATFTVTLPKHTPQIESFIPQPRAVAESESKAEGRIQLDQIPSLAGVRVLVVDDQEEALTLLNATLTEAGAQVIAVSSGAEALAVLAGQSPNERPHVLILDISMPDEDGYQVLQRVRAWETERGLAPTARIPAIALTALGRTEDRVRTLTAGFKMHIVKPAEPAELLLAVASLIKRYTVGRGV